MCFRRHAVAVAIASSTSATAGLPTPVRPSGSTRPTGFGNRRGRGSGAPLRQPCLRLLALASLCLANPVPVAIVQAQTETTLVSNAGQTSEPTLDISNAISQLFTTGSQVDGYTFTTVDVYLGTQNFDGGCTATGSVAVSIYSNNQSNQPDSSVYSLTAPSALIDKHFLVAEQRWMVGHLMDPRRRRSSQFCSAKIDSPSSTVIIRPQSFSSSLQTPI